MRRTAIGGSDVPGGALRRVRLAGVLLAVVAGAALLPTCAHRSQPGEDATPTRPEDRDDAEVTTTAPGTADVRVRESLRTPSTNFPEGDLGSGARVRYTGDAFRIVSPGRPVFIPLADPDLAGLTSAEMSVELTPVSGFGTAGFICGLDAHGSYMLSVGRNELGETYAVIGYYDRDAGTPHSPDRSQTEDAVRDVDLPAVGEPMTVGAACLPGDGPNEALLTVTLDGHEVVRVTADRGRPEGPVGFVTWGQGTEPLLTDFTSFALSGSLRGRS